MPITWPGSDKTGLTRCMCVSGLCKWRAGSIVFIELHRRGGLRIWAKRGKINVDLVFLVCLLLFCRT